MSKTRLVSLSVLAAGAVVGIVFVSRFQQPSIDETNVQEPVVHENPAQSKEADGSLRVMASGLLHEALPALEVREDWLRCRTLADMAVLHVRLGDAEAARSLFEQARRLSEDMPAQYWVWRELAKAYARAGEAGQALDLANAIPDAVPNFRGKDKEFRAMVLQESALALAETGNEKQALRLVELIENKDSRAWVRSSVFKELALAQARAGRIESALKAVEAMEDAETQVMTLTGILYDNAIFPDYPYESGIALIQHEAGDGPGARKTVERALAIARKLQKEQARSRSLAAVACVQARIGEPSTALKTTREVTIESWRALALAAIGKAQASAGRVNEAFHAIDQLKDQSLKVHGLYHVAAGRARAGDARGAKDTFQKAIDLVAMLPEEERAGHYHNIASAQAVARDFEGALETAKASHSSLIVIGNVAYQQAKSGDVRSALMTVKKFPEGSESHQGSTLQAVARAQTVNGAEQDALAWARALPVPQRAYALIGVTEGLLEQMQRKRQ